MKLYNKMEKECYKSAAEVFSSNLKWVFTGEFTYDHQVFETAIIKSLIENKENLETTEIQGQTVANLFKSAVLSHLKNQSVLRKILKATIELDSIFESIKWMFPMIIAAISNNKDYHNSTKVLLIKVLSSKHFLNLLEQDQHRKVKSFLETTFDSSDDHELKIIIIKTKLIKPNIEKEKDPTILLEYLKTYPRELPKYYRPEFKGDFDDLRDHIQNSFGYLDHSILEAIKNNSISLKTVDPTSFIRYSRFLPLNEILKQSDFESCLQVLKCLVHAFRDSSYPPSNISVPDMLKSAYSHFFCAILGFDHDPETGKTLEMKHSVLFLGNPPQK